MENTIDYSKAPKDIQDATERRERICEIPDPILEETPNLLQELKQLNKKIDSWEETQKE